MIKTLFFLLIFLIGTDCYSQNLYVTTSTTLYNLNNSECNILSNRVHDDSSNSHQWVNQSCFNPSRDEIISMKYNRLIFQDLNTSSLRYVNMPSVPTSSNDQYVNLIVANNKLFVVYYQQTGGNIFLYEVNQNTGEIIDSHLITEGAPSGAISDIAFNSGSNEILILNYRENILYKYNVNNETFVPLALPQNYASFELVNNRFFLFNRVILSSSIERAVFQEIDLQTGSVINTINFPENIYNMSIQYTMTSLNYTNEIFILCRGRFTANEYYVYRFNLQSSSLFTYRLPYNGYYNTIISTDQSILGTVQFNNNTDLKVKRAYNLLGKIIDPETKNQVVILEYENGSLRKIFQAN